MTDNSEDYDLSACLGSPDVVESPWESLGHRHPRSEVRGLVPVVPEWQQQIEPALREGLAELFGRLHEAIRIQSLEAQVATLKIRLANLERASPCIAPIQTLAPEPYELVKPLHAVISRSEDEYVASIYDANLSASGETELDAFCNLKDIIVATFEVLTDLEQDELGPGPGHQLLVLRQFIRRS